jgi:hypothetical protein
VLGLVQEGELVGHCSESECRSAGRPYSGGEAGDDPRSVGLLVLGGSPEEDLVAQLGYQLAEFGDLLGDGDAVGRTVKVSEAWQFPALRVEDGGRGTQSQSVGEGGAVHGEFHWKGRAMG